MNRLNGYGKLYGERGWHTSDFCWIGIIYLRNTRQMRSFYRSGRNVINGGDVGKTGMDEDVAQERRRTGADTWFVDRENREEIS